MKVMRLLAVAAALGFACAGPVAAADKDAPKSERQRIAAEARAAKEKCKDLKDNAKDICMAEAKGQEKLAKAELALKEKDTPRNRYDVAAAKTDLAYEIAKEKCDDMKGKERTQCLRDARAARDSAKKQARADRDAATPRKERKTEKEAK